jgi:hypothetical protein
MDLDEARLRDRAGVGDGVRGGSSARRKVVVVMGLLVMLCVEALSNRPSEAIES